jgi:hypothetical protein
MGAADTPSDPRATKLTAARRAAIATEKHAWAWPAPAIVAVAVAGATGGWATAATMTAFIVALAGAWLAEVASVRTFALGAFVAAAVAFGGLALRAREAKRQTHAPIPGASRATLQRAKDLQNAVLTARRLPGIDLHGKRLQGVEAVGVVLRGATLDGSRLDGADLAGADLRGASLRRTCLRGSVLTGALLQGADFAGASVEGVVGSGAHNGARHWRDTPAQGVCGRRPPEKRVGAKPDPRESPAAAGP